MPNDPVSLDSFDRHILTILSTQGRISVVDLARRIGLSKSPTQARLKRLEDSGIIHGYRALIDPVRLGLNHIAFVELRLSNTSEAALSAFNEAAIALPEIEQIHMIAGNFDYLLKIRTQDMASYRAVLAEKISAMPYVASTSTFVSMEAVKDEATARFETG